jgi:chromosome segregation ATPase
LAQKIQLLERRKLSPSNEGKPISSPIGRKFALQNKLGNRTTEYEQDKATRVEVEELQAALNKALRENASLKDNQDQVVRLEKLFTSERRSNEKLQHDLDHAKKVHAAQLKSYHEESSHLGATIDELEAVNKVLNSTLQELSAQPLDHHHRRVSSDSIEFHRLTKQWTDLQEKYRTICEQLEREKEQHRTTQRQLAHANSATQKSLEGISVHGRESALIQAKLDDALSQIDNLMLEKQALQQDFDTLRSRDVENGSRERGNLLQFNRQLSEQQTENDDLKFALQELTIALEKAKEHAAAMDKNGQSETQQDIDLKLRKAESNLAALTEKYETTAQAFEDEKIASAKLKEQVSELQSSATFIQQLEQANITYQESLVASTERINALEDEIAHLYSTKNVALEQLERQTAMEKEIAEKQRIIDQLLGDISELQSHLSESRDQMDVHIDQLNALRQSRDHTMTEYEHLQEAHKQLEMECLKLMDEIIVHANDDFNEDPVSPETPPQPGNFSYALKLSHRQTKLLEGKVANLQAEMMARMNTATQQHQKVIHTKDATIAKLSKELSDFEHLVENKIFRESELEERLIKEQDRRKRLEHEILDIQVQSHVPISPRSDHGSSNAYDDDASTTRLKQDSIHYIAQGKRDSISESYCGICDRFDHDTIDCKKLGAQGILNTHSSPDKARPVGDQKSQKNHWRAFHDVLIVLFNFLTT